MNELIEKIHQEFLKGKKMSEVIDTLKKDGYFENDIMAGLQKFSEKYVSNPQEYI